MQWIKEVELVDSVDELRSSSSTRGISMPNFEVLDARIASALNKIIHNSQFKRRISLEEQKAQKQDRFLRGRQIPYLICDYFRVTGSHDSVENCEGCLVVRSGHGPQAEVAQVFGLEPLVELGGRHLEGLEEEQRNEEEKETGEENNHNTTHRCTCMDGMTRARQT